MFKVIERFKLYNPVVKIIICQTGGKILFICTYFINKTLFFSYYIGVLSFVRHTDTSIENVAFDISVILPYLVYVLLCE